MWFSKCRNGAGKASIFWAQQSFPLKCKHEKFLLKIESKGISTSSFSEENQIGFFTAGSWFSIQLQIIAISFHQDLRIFWLQELGKIGMTWKGCCPIKSLPTKLQNANEDLIALSRSVEQNRVFYQWQVKKTWTSVSPAVYLYTIQLFPNALHGFEAVPITCKNYYFTKRSGEKIEWALVVGCGYHTHYVAIKKPNRKGV